MLKDITSLQIRGANFSELTSLSLTHKDNKFTKALLIYGKNGSGKSTIAKAFKKISGEQEPTIEEAIIKGENGDAITLTEQERKSIFVFDEDFIDKNIRIDSDGLTSIIMLGEQGNLRDKIKNLEGEISAYDETIKQIQAELKKYEGENSPDFYLNRMCNILRQKDGWAERKGIKIRDNRKSWNVTNDTYKKFISLIPKKTYSELFSDFYSKLEELHRAKNGTSFINDPVYYDFRAYQNYNTQFVNELIKKKIERPELSEREKYLLCLVQTGRTNELQERIEYIKTPNNNYCPYCLQDLEDDYKHNLLEKIQRVLTDDVQKHQEELRSVIFSDLNIDLYAYRNLPSYENCIDLINKFKEVITFNNSLIEQKINDPYTPIQKELAGFIEILAELQKFLEKLETERNISNERAENTKQIINELEKINDELAYHEIINIYHSYAALKSEQDKVQEKYNAIELNRKNKTDEIDSLNAKRKGIHIAIDLINEALKYIFCADKRLHIELNGENYMLFSNGRPVSPQCVSVGERNIIGLCYFFTEIMRDKETKAAYEDECLIVIDDPISSYDFENQVGILSFLNLKLKQFLNGNMYSRFIIMTHDLHSFCEIGDIYKRLADNCSFACYELKNRTMCKIELKNHNEYTELIKIIYDYANGKATDYEIVIGNIMRQTLEAFSTFEYKRGIEGITADEILSNLKEGYKNHFQNLLYRLVLNGGSHRKEQVQNMKVDFFSEISEQGKRRTAKEIICFMYLLNKQHVLSHLGESSKETLEDWCKSLL